MNWYYIILIISISLISYSAFLWGRLYQWKRMRKIIARIHGKEEAYGAWYRFENKE